MKVDIVLLPTTDSVNLSFWSAGKGTRFVCLGRRKHLLVLSAVLACAMGVWFMTQMSTMANNAMATARVLWDRVPVIAEVVSARTDEVKVESPSSRGWLRRILAKISREEPARSRVLPFDGSRVLSRGERVLVRFGGEITIAEVAGAPKETVLLLRGTSPERLYVLGDESYAVMANQQSKIVRVSDIMATVTAPMQIARNR